MSRKRKWLIGIAVATMLGIVALFVAASILARRFEPYVREQAIEYLRKRFDSDVELAALRVHLPKTSPLRLLLTKGRGALARVEGEGISLRHKGRRDVPPMFAMKKFRFEVDLGTLFDTPKTVPSVLLEGMEISIPPKGERPKLSADSSPENDSESQTGVLIKEVTIRDTHQYDNFFRKRSCTCRLVVFRSSSSCYPAGVAACRAAAETRGGRARRASASTILRAIRSRWSGRPGASAARLRCTSPRAGSGSPASTGRTRRKPPRKQGGEASAHVLDVTDGGACRAVLGNVREQLGRLGKLSSTAPASPGVPTSAPRTSIRWTSRRSAG